VCGQSADAIKFVQVYFGLDFQSAISKLNDDFCLGLPIGQRIDRRKQLEMGRIAFERKRKAEQQQKERQQIEDDYWAAFDEWKRLDDNRRNYAPKSPTEPLHPLFVEALKNIAGAEYNLSCAEIARYEYENRNSHNS
jgi:DNA primase